MVWHLDLPFEKLVTKNPALTVAGVKLKIQFTIKILKLKLPYKLKLKFTILTKNHKNTVLTMNTFD